MRVLPYFSLPAIVLCAISTHAVPRTIKVTVDTHKPLATVDPSTAIGAAVDGYEHGDIPKIYTKANVKSVLSAGLGPISYRLRTELGIEAWHWNPRGRWSDPKHKCGYWTSSSVPGPPIRQCYGYALPRRGDTFDQANNSGYSRIDDGDPKTFWKSNPYLSTPLAPEDHPQWVVVELGKETPVDTVRIDWAEPYGTRFLVQYWSQNDPTDTPRHIDETLYQDGEWRTFPHGAIDHGRGGIETIRLSTKPISAPVIRIVLLSSSRTGPRSNDIRDRLGYAVRELYVGTTDAGGRFHDVLRHGKTNKTQTVIYVSSTDPWHRASDIDRDVEQPGFDRIYSDGITRGMSMMVPVGVAYDTPANAAAEVRYLRRRGYPVDRVELGEEPDGQYLTPEDYGALYVEFARALHKVDPRLHLGGPSFQTMAWKVNAWPSLDPSATSRSLVSDVEANDDDSSWTKRFIDYLRDHHSLQDLAFFSSEFYFYNDVCAPPSPKLIKMPKLVDKAFARWRSAGVPSTIPWYATEFGYSPYAAEPEVDLPGALLDADFSAHFLSVGGSTAYFYGIEPNTLIKEVSACDTWGNLALWQSVDDRHIVAPFAAYWVMRMVTEDWLGGRKCGMRNVEHGISERTRVGGRTERATVFAVDVDGPKVEGEPVVTGYAVRRSDGQLAVMVINKSAKEAFRVNMNAYRGKVDVVQYSGRDYVWHANGEHGWASPNRPPDRWTSKSTGAVVLPPYSITVIQGKSGN